MLIIAIVFLVQLGRGTHRVRLHRENSGGHLGHRVHALRGKGEKDRGSSTPADVRVCARACEKVRGSAAPAVFWGEEVIRAVPHLMEGIALQGQTPRSEEVAL